MKDRKFGYDVSVLRPSLETLGAEVKKLSRVLMGVVSFWRKINHLGATNEVKFCCVRPKTKFFEINFQSLTF